MDLDGLSAGDLKFVDAEVKKEMDKSNGSSVLHVQDNLNQLNADVGDDNDDPQMEHLECLKSNFKHSSFRSKQWDIIKTLSEKRDVCAVMQAGYGKSLCFHFPAVYFKKMTLVISPSISSMKAQVTDLETNGIPACLVCSAQKDSQILDHIASGNFTVVYSSPKYITSPKGDGLLSIMRDRLALIAIDEAQCLSQLSHDFCQDFKKLNIIREKIPEVPILAVTATATESVRYDIINLLRLNEPRVIMTSFDRSNLEFIIKKKTTVENDVVDLIKNVDGSVIVYVLKPTDAEEIAKKLTENGITCDNYPADMDIDQRSSVMEKFLKDEFKVIVATIAFDMGIDKKDIRCVVHYGASENLESYYQEVGRAGRDGKSSTVITFFGPEDFEPHDWFLEGENNKQKTAKMRDFLYATQCRRKIILQYFGEDTTTLSPRPNCCDNCTAGLCSWKLSDLYDDVDDDGFYDFADEAKLLLGAIICFDRNDVATEINLLGMFLRGELDDRTRSVQGERCHGSGRMRPDHYWMALAEQLAHSEFLVPNTSKLILTPKADEWLRSPTTLPLKAIGRMFEYFDKKTFTPLAVTETNPHTVTGAVTDLVRKHYALCDEFLKEVLSEVREAIALTRNVPDRESIISNFELEKMVRTKPKNLKELRKASIGRFSTERQNRYGPSFVGAISKFTKCDLEMQNVLCNHPMPNVEFDHFVSPQILNLLKDRQPIDQILRETYLTEEQFFGDIELLIQTGQPVQKTDIAYLSHIDFNIFQQCFDDDIDTTTITDDMIKEIQSKYFNLTNQRIQFDFARVALIYYAVRFHLDETDASYIDCEDDILVHPEKLIMPPEQQDTSNNTLETDRPHAPYRRRLKVAPKVIDYIFPQFHRYEPYQPHQKYDAVEYEVYEVSDEDEGSVDEDEGSVDENEGSVDGEEGSVDGEEGSVDGEEGSVDEDEGSADEDEGSVDGDEGSVDGKEGSVDGDEGSVDGDEGSVDGDEGSVDGDEAIVDGDEGSVDGDEGSVDGDEGSVDGDEAIVDCDEGSVEGDEGSVEGDEGSVDGDEGSVDGDEAIVDCDEGSVDGDEGNKSDHDNGGDSEDESQNRGDDDQNKGDDGQNRGDDGQNRGDDGQNRGDDGQNRGDDGQNRGDDGENRGDDGENRGDDGENRGDEGSDHGRDDESNNGSDDDQSDDQSNDESDDGSDNGSEEDSDQETDEEESDEGMDESESDQEEQISDDDGDNGDDGDDFGGGRDPKRRRVG